MLVRVRTFVLEWSFVGASVPACGWGCMFAIALLAVASCVVAWLPFGWVWGVDLLSLVDVVVDVVWRWVCHPRARRLRFLAWCSRRCGVS